MLCSENVPLLCRELVGGRRELLGAEGVMAGLSAHPVLSQCPSPGAALTLSALSQLWPGAQGRPAACRQDRGGHQALAHSPSS